MDGPDLVTFRITLNTPAPLEIRFPTGDRIHIRKAENPFLAMFGPDGWIVIPSKGGRGLPIKTWKDIWGDEKIEIETGSDTTGWHSIDSEGELDAESYLPKAAE